MSVASLIEQFPLLATAPEGVKRLRELILELAVRGKLVPQDPSDEPASELLKRIQAEKAKLVAAGKIRKDKPLPEIGKDEQPFDLPEGWGWVRFGDVAQHNSGKTLDKGRNSGIPRDYITTSNLYWGRFELGNVRQMLIRDDELDKCTARRGDLLICEGGEAGRAAVWAQDSEICFQNHIHRARLIGSIDPYYAYRTFERLNLTGEIEQYRKGVGISNMSSKSLASIPFPLPPLPEQHRIVAKIDELMALCDKLETQQTDAASAHATLVKTLLDTLTQSPSAVDFPASWQRIAQHFDTLFTTKDSINALKQAILQLAVMGKLVPQDPSDEPVSELLKRIHAEKAKLVAEGKIRKDKPLPVIGDDEKPFALPVGWEWSRIGDYSLFTEYGLSEKTFDTSNGIPVLKMGDIQGGSVILGGQKTVPVSTEGVTNLLLKTGDLLYNRTNSAELVGKTGIYTGADGTYTFASYLIRIRCATDLVTPKYLNNVMNAPYFRLTQILPLLKQQCGQANVNGTALRHMLAPIPPAAEQHRIVAKVDELMVLCDQLAARLKAAREVAVRYSTAATEVALQAA